MCNRLLLIAVTLTFGATHLATQNVDRRAPFSGQKLLLNSGVLMCTSDQLAAAGYWNGPGSAVQQGALINRESNVNRWRITITRAGAEVIRFSGTSQTIEKPELYTVEVTPAGGLLLIWKDRPEGFSPQIITIDTTTSSFVYTTQYVDLFMNRANVFYGVCQASS
jgi:hypothetical protein